MDTTAHHRTAGETDTAGMLERLAATDPAEAPDIADELARVLSAGLDDGAAPHQLEAEFTAGEKR